MQWAPDTSNTVRSLVNLQYRPAGDRVVNLGYRYDEGSIEQWEASAAWPLDSKPRLTTWWANCSRPSPAIAESAPSQ